MVKDLPRCRHIVMVAGYAVISVWGVLTVKQTLLWRDSVALWEETLKVTTTSPAVYCNYGAASVAKGELEKALLLFQKAVEISPGLDVGYLNMGKIYHGMGRKDKALEMFDIAWALNPENMNTLALVAATLRDEGHRSEAIELLEQANAQHPNSMLLSELGTSYRNAGREKDALKAFDKAILLGPLQPDPYTGKALTLLSRGDIDDAVVLLKKSVDLEPTPVALNALGMGYAQKGDTEQALQEFLKAYKVRPDMPEIRKNIMTALTALKDSESTEVFCSDCAAPRFSMLRDRPEKDKRKLRSRTIGLIPARRYSASSIAISFKSASIFR